MSFSLDVFAHSVGASITQDWILALATHGLVLEPPPRFDLRQWRGGWAGFRVTIHAARYPANAIAAGFELDVGSNDEFAELADSAPHSVRSVLTQAAAVFHFGTSASRTVADLRLQALGAAVLTEVSRGVLYDPQQDEFYFGPSALANARREAESFEATADSAAWRLDAFVGRSGAG